MSSPETHGAMQGIAIIGMAGRFPGARNLGEFWRNLQDGVESVSFFSDEELIADGVDPELVRDSRYVKANCLLEEIELFDASFFGFTPREAELTDPQHRLFLECAWEVLENAGYAPGDTSLRTAVFGGTGSSTYLLNHLMQRPDIMRSVSAMQLTMGNNKDFVPTRVSYKLNLKGPSLNVNTACSTSLVAVHMACQCLLDYQCDVALAGGVGIQVPQKRGYTYHESGISSPDGHCRAFDAEAQGTIGGSGVGIVALKRLEDALEDGDSIRAVIKGSAINNDGSGKVGFTAPSIDGQSEVIAEALSLAEFEPETVTYVETHGTGTPLGDPIEIAALTKAFRAGTGKNRYCAIGSIKTNVGHLDEAAGVAGLIKTVLAMEHRQIPASLNFQSPNPKIDFANSPFFVNAERSEWKSPNAPRRAGISSFGIGGTNCHVALEEAPSLESSDSARDWQLLTLSAKTPTALDAAAKNLSEHLKSTRAANLADVAYTLQLGRQSFEHRRVALCQNVDDAIATLDSPNSERVLSADQARQDRPVVLMFSGQGAQYPQMGAGLYDLEPTFRTEIDRCAEIAAPILGTDLRQLMYPVESERRTAEENLKRTEYAQPALFATEYALAKLWMHWDFQPEACIGHSIGEYVAACLAGVFGLVDALALVCARGQLMQSLPGGSMLTVALPEEDVQPFLLHGIDLAAVNAPSLCVLSGPTEAVATLSARLNDNGVDNRLLQTSHAFHSSMLDAILEPFAERVRSVERHAPNLPYVSNLTGDWIRAEEATDPGYWVQQARRTVRFSAGMERLLEDPQRVLLEAGPGRTLATLAKRHRQSGRKPDVLTSLRHPLEDQSDAAHLTRTLGQLWLAGVPVDWLAFHVGEKRRRIPLPTYPFERKRYWIEPARTQNDSGASTWEDAETKKSDVADWFYVPSWKRTLPAPAAPAQSSHPCWLILEDECGIGSGLGKRLRLRNEKVVSVGVSSAFSKLDPLSFTINLRDRNHYEMLIGELAGAGLDRLNIVHAWSLTPDATSELELQDYLDRSFFSLLNLAQSLAQCGSLDGIHIDVVTNGVQDVTGSESLHPEKNTILGLVKVIPQEFTGAQCRCFDIDLSTHNARGHSDLVERLLREVSSPASDSIVALRGRQRWVQEYESTRLEPAHNPPVRLRDGGTYLISGGLGGVGLILAEYLVKNNKAKLILLGRSAFPPRDDWARLSEGDVSESGSHPRFDLRNELPHIENGEAEIGSRLNIQGLETYPGVEARVNELCTSLILDYFKRNRVDVALGHAFQKSDLLEQLGVKPEFHKFVDFFVSVLEEDGPLHVDDGQFAFTEKVDGFQNADRLLEGMRRDFPGFSGTLDLLEHCASHYPGALSGAIPAISVLYPEGSSELLEKAGRNTVAYSKRAIYIELLKTTLLDLAQRDPGRPLRILEVGAGDGILAKSIAPSLSGLNVEYFATDLGRAFVVRLEKEAAQASLDFMRFGVLDASKDPATQGFAESDFDFILGLDVIHATPSLSETIGELQKLLAPHGSIALVETVRGPRWNHMIWGLAEGWWHFEDRDIRRNSPLLDLDAWEDVFKKQGFETVAGFPRDGADRSVSDFGLVIAQLHADQVGMPSTGDCTTAASSATPADRRKIQKLLSLEELGSEVTVVRGDVANIEEMERIVADTAKRYGRIDGVIHAAGVTNREYIFNTINETNRQQADALFQAKVYGTRTLDRVLQERDIDFCMLISSNAATLGGLGFCGYSAASAFLDAFAAERRNRAGLPWISTDWDGWPTSEVLGKELNFQTSIDCYAMTGEEAESAFERALAQDTAQLVVSAGDLNVRLRRWRQTETPQVSDCAEAAERVVSGHERPDLQTEYETARTETERILTGIWEELLGIERIGIHDNFFDLDGDSLLGTQLVSRLGKTFELELPFRCLFEAPTVAGLAEQIDRIKSSVRQLALAPIGEAADDEDEGEL